MRPILRRRLIEDPPSRLAIWARRCALFALATAFISVIIVRSGMLEFVPAMATFGGALLFAAIAILLALAAAVVIWREGLGGIGATFAAFFIGTALLAYPGYLGYRAYKLPAISDITTDPIDPPRFDAIARLRPRGASNPTEYAGLYAAEQQQRAYPEVEPLELTVDARTAFQAALAVVTKRRWAIILQREPQPGRRDGRIEAVARTMIMGFREDVVIRVREQPDGSRVDVRSASRYGHHDFGSNAARIKALTDDIDEASASPTEEKKERPPKKPAPAKGAQGSARR